MTDKIKEDTINNHEDIIRDNLEDEYQFSNHWKTKETGHANFKIDAKTNSIPTINSSNLKEIKIMVEVGTPVIFDQIRNNPEFMNELCELFIESEKKKDMISLHRLCKIFKLILLSGDYSSLVVILSEGYIMNVIGALEYDKDLSKMIKHRDFINNKAVFKYVIDLPKESCFLIQRAYKLKYLRDVIVSRYVDDTTLNTLTSMINVCHQEIISHILSHPEVIKEIIEKLRNHDTIDTVLDVLGFLKELYNLSQQSSVKIFQSLSEMGLYDILLELIKMDHSKLKSLYLLNRIVEYDSAGVRNVFLNNPHYLSNLITCFKRSQSINELNYINDIFNLVLQSPKSKNTVQLNQHDKLLELFYSQYAEEYFSILYDQDYKDEIVLDKRLKLLDLMTQFVMIHLQMMMAYIVKNDVLQRTNWLIMSSNKCLILDQLKLIRTCLSTKENAYLDYIIKENLFEPIIELYMKYKDNYNLINSTILELFYFIKNNRIYKISSYIIERFYPQLDSIEDVDIFLIMKHRYDEMKEKANHPIQSNSNRRSVLDDINEFIHHGDSGNSLSFDSSRRRVTKRLRSRSEYEIDFKKQKKF